jgi:cytochrome b subunit of formate dehydrogenase
MRLPFSPTVRLLHARQSRAVLLLLAILVALSVAPVLGQSVDDCLACHGDKSMTTERNGKTVSLFADRSVLLHSPHAKLVCVACHAGFDPGNVPHKEKIEPVNCLNCHTDASTKHQFHAVMFRSREHTPALLAACKQCHGRHDIVRVHSVESPFAGPRLAETCGACHKDVAKTFSGSAHGEALKQNVKGAPSCIGCHRNAISRPTASDSTQWKVAEEKVCLSCHLDDPGVRGRTAPSAGFIAAYDKSVHGAALARGNSRAANCVDCHGSHEMKKGADPSSKVNKNNIATTCAKCHEGIAATYRESVHGVALKNGVESSPTCTDCHGEHNILKHTDPNSPVAAANVSSQVCSPCHASVKLTAKFGLAGDRYKSFADSYHGLATRAGNVEVANCASCHGVHNIKRSSDSTSMVNKANLVKTCGRCHPGANANFTKGSVHVIATSSDDAVLYLVSTTYIVLIVVTIGGMFVHNLLDFVKKGKRRLKIRRGEIHVEELPHRLYVRMTLSERLQHGSLLLSFITLVLTGFALRYPEAWWVEWVRQISPVMFEIRGIAHRVAAVVMVGASVYHLYYVLFVPRGRQLIKDLLPTIKDLTDAVGVFKYNLGLSPVKPKFGRFSYIEKSEYWALVWGTIVMAGTGLILWFDNTFLGLLTKLWWDVARTVHYYEAWLATLAIIVWHFYFVIFNPDVYPINLAFWKGTLTEEEMEDEHPLELEELRKRELGMDEVEEKP